ncbi:hypothetical protein LUZ63_003215 [Rhynchospora breviuscula]|uniref:Domain X domain-containing protein n=1 Tax=Rhynchospora breviuscula TaxID=2022672 RepID=A0A9Q0HYS2_9POAL|nr:hypothetical protein LUZ63_003215 [Rhynchospora breviuscula]
MRDLLQYCKRRGLLIELGGEAILVIRSSERGQLLQPAPFQSHSFLIRIFYARYADDLLLGIVGAVFILIEIQKRITHFLQSGLKGSAGSTTIAARSKVEFLGTVIREVPPRTTPRKFLRELEKRLRVKHRIHITACHLRSAIHSKFRDLGKSIPIKELTRGMSGRGRLLDAVQLADTLGKEGLRSTQVSVLWGTVKHIRQGARAISLLHSSGRSKVPPDNREPPGMNVFLKELGTPAGRKAAGKGKGNWAGSFSSEFPIQIEAPIKKILRRLRDRGIISRRRPRPIHVASLTNVSDGDIVNRSADIAISPLSYYRCCDNLYQVRTIVDYQIRWSAIKTLAHKHKSSARHIIPKYPKDLNIVNKKGCQTLAEFPNSIELGKLGPGQDSNNDLEKNSLANFVLHDLDNLNYPPGKGPALPPEPELEEAPQPPAEVPPAEQLGPNPLEVAAQRLLLLQSIQAAGEERVDTLGELYGWPVTEANRRTAVLGALNSIDIGGLLEIEDLTDLELRLVETQRDLLDFHYELYYESMMQIEEAEEEEIAEEVEDNFD